MMKTTANLLERTTPQDRYADFCLWDYQPVAPPVGKLRSANLLWEAIDAAGPGSHLRAACAALRDALGPFQTVFGIKKVGSRLSFEFYFYDYARLARQVSITRVLAILGPLIRCPLKPLERRPYFMFSLDLDEQIAAGQRPLDTINLYIGNPGSNVSSGICYEYSHAGLRLANFYFFFDARKEMNDVTAKIGCSVHQDLQDLPFDQILPMDLRHCATIVVANKRVTDGVYFSRIGIDPLIDFLERQEFPAALVSLARQHRGDLDHMLYDVGIDYVCKNGAMTVTKSAFYGLL